MAVLSLRPKATRLAAPADERLGALGVSITTMGYVNSAAFPDEQRRLFGFGRTVELAVGASDAVELTMMAEALTEVDTTGARWVRNGTYDVRVGACGSSAVDEEGLAAQVVITGPAIVVAPSPF